MGNSEVHSVIVPFLLEKRIFVNFRQKCFKTPEKLSLAVCVSYLGAKYFLVIFGSFIV